MKYILIAFALTLISSRFCAGFQPSVNGLRALLNKKKSMIVQMAPMQDDKKSATFGFVGGLGVAANMVIDYSLYIIKTTGCNVVPKFDIQGLLAQQGVSLAMVIGVFVWSVSTKVKTGSGLPAGPGGMLGAAEGLSFLTVAAIPIVVLFNIIQFGGLTSGIACESLSYTQPFSAI